MVGVGGSNPLSRTNFTNNFNMLAPVEPQDLLLNSLSKIKTTRLLHMIEIYLKVFYNPKRQNKNFHTNLLNIKNNVRIYNHSK